MITEFGKALGAQIKRSREAKGFTQAQLAIALGKSVETISNFERGRTIPSLLTLNNLAGKLGISIASFFVAEGEATPSTETTSKAAMTVRNAADVLPADDLEILAGLTRVLETRRR